MNCVRYSKTKFTVPNKDKASVETQKSSSDGPRVSSVTLPGVELLTALCTCALRFSAFHNNSSLGTVSAASLCL